MCTLRFATKHFRVFFHPVTAEALGEKGGVDCRVHNKIYNLRQGKGIRHVGVYCGEKKLRGKNSSWDRVRKHQGVVGGNAPE